jgi:PelA/Pel-15E family pectate lyase
LILAASPVAADGFPWQRYSGYPDAWYGGNEAKQIAAHVLSHQSPLGGWPKNIDTGDKKYDGDPKSQRGTLEGGATIGEMRFLGRHIHISKDQRYRQAIEQGLKYILDAQYPTGGWPLYYPQPKGSSRFITIGDNHMLNIMELLHDVATSDEFTFLKKMDRVAARKAFARGIECIVKSQFVIEDQPTAWCHHHDEKTLEPRPGRRSEPVAISAIDSAGILLMLMSIEIPDPTVIRAIHGGCAWFESAQLAGIRLEQKKSDVQVVVDLDASPLWARLYEIGKNRAIFTTREGAVKYRLADLDAGRRAEMPWYGTWGAVVLNRYEEWRGQ